MIKLSEAFPHAQVVQLLHEQGGRQISREVATDAPGVRGAYRGWDFETLDERLGRHGGQGSLR